MWTTYDYDYTSVYKVMYLQLSRLEKRLLDDQYHSHGRNNQHTKKLQTAKEICKRLYDQDSGRVSDSLYNNMVFKYTEEVHLNKNMRDLLTEKYGKETITVLSKAGFAESLNRDKHLKKQLSKLMEQNLYGWWC
jgi:hypothetical protein